MKQLILILFACFISISYGQCISYACIFNGILYANGEVLTFTCFQLQCTNGTWIFTNIISQICEECWISNDPHFYTFDNTYYDWHGRCNYSISQPINCTASVEFDSYDAPYGIYGHFYDCYSNPSASCLRKTTYKVNIYTAILITHDDILGTVTIEINGNSIPIPATPGVPSDCTNLYPAVLWQDGDCVRIVGIDYSIQACPYSMYIYTSISHLQNIAGLCGYFTGIASDDFSKRPCGPVVSVIPEFAISWKTNTFDKGCYDKYRSASQVRGRRRRRQAGTPPCDETTIRPDCEKAVLNAVGGTCGTPTDANNIEYAIENCVKDCCAEPKFCEHWKQIAVSFICKQAENDRMQNGGREG